MHRGAHDGNQGEIKKMFKIKPEEFQLPGLEVPNSEHGKRL